jgi:hypothetical protein
MEGREYERSRLGLGCEKKRTALPTVSPHEHEHIKIMDHIDLYGTVGNCVIGIKESEETLPVELRHLEDPDNVLPNSMGTAMKSNQSVELPKQEPIRPPSNWQLPQAGNSHSGGHAITSLRSSFGYPSRYQRRQCSNWTRTGHTRLRGKGSTMDWPPLQGTDTDRRGAPDALSAFAGQALRRTLCVAGQRKC